MSRFERFAAALFLPRSSSSSIALSVWSAAALVSLAVASAIAVQPGYFADLMLVRDWLAHVRGGTGNPYLEFRNLDYPPHALLMLLPLAWLSEPASGIVVIPLIVASAAAATWLMSGWMARQFGIELTQRDRLMLVLLVLAGSSLRGAIWRGQLAPLAFLFGAIALHLKQRYPAVSALALALCAFKPHVAIAFAFAILITNGSRILIGAGAIVLALSWCFAAMLGVSLTETWQAYVANLWLLYDGPEQVRGLLSIRWVIEDLIGSYELGTMIYLIAAAVTAVMLLDAALGTTERRQRTRVIAGLFVWALLFLPQQLYHGWMAAPAVWLMMWPESELIRNDRARLAAVSLFVTFGVIDVPRLLRQVIDSEANWELGWVTYALSPIRLALLFALVFWAILRRPTGQVPDNTAARGPAL